MKHSSFLPLQWLLFVFLIHTTCLSQTQSFSIPRLSAIGRTTLKKQATLMATSDAGDLQTFYYNQTLDHFNYRQESYTNFQQRYLINFKYWGGPNSSAPIFAYLGAEEPLDLVFSVIGFPTDIAATFNALVVFIEHRYYGESVPFGSREEAMKNASTIGYFNSAQALADYAEILLYIKETFHAQKSPVIVFGGSYGGMLASWFRLKYPHVALGALASSAPILYFDDITPQDAYFSVVTKDFREASETCYETILNSWPEINRVANSDPNGLSILSQKFNTCQPLKSASELTLYLEDMYIGAAQYDEPPFYPVSTICSGIDGASSGSDILSKIHEGVVAYLGNDSCKFNGPIESASVMEIVDGWQWQTCSEMVIPIGSGNNTMFPYEPFDLRNFTEWCKQQYGVWPRPHWVTSYYGGHDIKLILERFASNIIFSNGLRDPYSSGGVLEDISDSVVAISTVNGSHCLDMLRAEESDPEWLIQQRRQEIDIIKSWIAQYYADLDRLMKRNKS